MNVNPALNLIAMMHMCDAYNESYEWSCDCMACQDIRSEPLLLESFWRVIKKLPPKPSEKSPPTVAFIEME